LWLGAQHELAGSAERSSAPGITFVWIYLLLSLFVTLGLTYFQRRIKIWPPHENTPENP
jgi:hypothetical protein